MVNKIAIASDHAGFELKQLLIESLSSDLEIEDLGTDSFEPCDFPDYATKVTDFVLDNEDTKGVLICGTGVGMSIAANKVKGIRASNCLLYTSPSPRDGRISRMPSSA